MGVSDDKNPSLLATPIKSSTKLTSSVEAKENRLASPNIQMKSSAKKNFMSPTISAASKAVAQKKKVLSEINSAQITEPTCAKFHHRRSSSLDLIQRSVDTSASVISSMDSLSSCTKDMSCAEDGPKSKPYDPVFNYCSPRPKFLLYKPNRRNEILRRYEMVDSTSSESDTGSSENEECLVKLPEKLTEYAVHGEYTDHKAEETAVQLKEEAKESVEEVHDEIDGHVAEEAPQNVDEYVNGGQYKTQEHVLDDDLTKHQRLSYQLVAGSTKLEHETTDIEIEGTEDAENDGDFEEDEVERGWSLKMYLTVWIVIFLVGLFTLYVSSMNSPSGFEEDGYWKIHSGLHGAAPFIYENASDYVIQGEMSKTGLDLASTVVLEPDNKIADKKVCKIPSPRIFNPEGDNSLHLYGIRNKDYGVGNEVEVPQTGATGASYVEMDVLADANDHAERTPEEIVVFQYATGDGLEVVNRELKSMEHNKERENDKTLHYFDEPEVSEASNPGLVDELSMIYTKGTDKNMIFCVGNEAEMPQTGATGASYIEMDVLADANDHAEGALEENVVFRDATGEGLEVGDMELESMECNEERANDKTLHYFDEPEVSEASNPDLVDEISMIYTKGTDKHMIFGVVSAVLLAFLGVLGFHMSKRTTMSLVTEADIAGIVANGGHVSQVKQVDPFVHSSYSRSGVDISVSQNFKSGLGAPKVELVGEFTVGEQEVSSYSLRNVDIENYNDDPSSFTQRNTPMSAKHSLSTFVDSQPAASEFSSTTGSPPNGVFSSQMRNSKKELPTSSIDSPSYGSFTTEMMFRKKEEAREKIIITPVRRSSRIRGRMTPGASQ